MAKIVVCPNILDTEVRENYEFNGPYIDWLQEHYPNGFGGFHVTSVNLSKLNVRDYDKILVNSDIVILAIYPGDPGSIALAWTTAVGWWATASALTKFVVGVVVSVALNYLANSIFGTAQVKQGKLASPSPTYDLSVPTNQARLGQPIPVIYGTVVAVPDLASAPYKWYDGNDMWVGLLMCIGQGWHKINEVRISGTPVEQFAPNNLFYQDYSPDGDQYSHYSRFGSIQNTFYQGKFFENVYTAPEVTDQELVAYHMRGPFIACPPKTETDLLSFDIEFPRGLYAIDDNGNIYPWGARIFMYAVPIDDEGNDIGPQIETSHFYTTYDNSGAGYTTPKRFTHWWSVPKARYRCSINRLPHCDTPDNCDNINDSTMIFTAMWTGLKAVLSTDKPVYGHTTMLAVMARATNGFSQDVLNRFSVNCTRKLHDFRTEEEALILTNSHAHAFYDIYRNWWYGANRPKIEVDLEALEKLYLRTNCLNGFNAVIDSRMTVWEALSLSIAALTAYPVTNGAIMSVVEDIAQDVATMCFNESNIVKDSLKLSYKFNDATTRDGVEVEFRDPENFEQRFVITPDTSVEPESINLIGCTNEIEALTYSERIWRQRLYRREFIRFATELEGNLPKIGALVSIDHALIASPTCYTIGSITPESDLVVSIEGHRYNPLVYGGDDGGGGGGGKRKVIINIPAVQEGIYDQNDTSVGYSRGITVSGYLPTDIIRVSLPTSQMFTAWSPFGNPNITFTEIPAKLTLTYSETIHLISMWQGNEVHRLNITVDGHFIELLPNIAYDAPEVTPEYIKYAVGLYGAGYLTARVRYDPPDQHHLANEVVDIELASGRSCMAWDYTSYTWYVGDPGYEDLEYITGNACTQYSSPDNQGATNWFKGLEGPNATAYTWFGTYGGLGLNGQFYNGYAAARAAFVPSNLTGSTQYTFVIQDDYFLDNSGGLSIQLETL